MYVFSLLFVVINVRNCCFKVGVGEGGFLYFNSIFGILIGFVIIYECLRKNCKVGKGVRELIFWVNDKLWKSYESKS